MVHYRNVILFDDFFFQSHNIPLYWKNTCKEKKKLTKGINDNSPIIALCTRTQEKQTNQSNWPMSTLVTRYNNIKQIRKKMKVRILRKKILDCIEHRQINIGQCQRCFWICTNPTHLHRTDEEEVAYAEWLACTSSNHQPPEGWATSLCLEGYRSKVREKKKGVEEQ